jgi:glycyl-tRNA synthetase
MDKALDHNKISLEMIVALSKRKGFVFQSSEIYGGFAATYDFGPLGILLKKNIEHLWRIHNVTTRTDVVEIEGAIFMHPKTWEASGHIGGFADIMVEDLVTKKRYRADHLIEDAGIMDNAGSLTCEQIDEIIEKHKLLSPDKNPLSKSKKFNLLVKTHLGPVEDESSVAYLKGESCQNIYLDFNQVQQTTRRKLPFGIAQIGKAFRNEITVKQYMFRTREFEQMDVQYFYDPQNPFVDGQKVYEYWKNYRMSFYTDVLKISEKNLSWRQHDDDELVFYAKDAWDINYTFGALGSKEMEGLHDRGSYDLDQHAKFSGKDLTYTDPFDPTRKFNPPIIESSAGFNRIFLATMFEFYDEEEIVEGDKKDVRTVLRFPFELAPFKIAILPLMKKDRLGEIAFDLFAKLKKDGLSSDYDDGGSIGKRYRRQDEVGTCFCVTVDYQTLEDQTVTLRNRDTMEQKRINISQINADFLRTEFGL